MTQITKDMTINDIISVDPEISNILMNVGMHCIGCMAAAGETLDEAAMVHGLDGDVLEKLINDYLSGSKKTEAAAQ